MKPPDGVVSKATESALKNLSALVPVIADQLADLVSVAKMARGDGEQARMVWTITSFAIDRLKDDLSRELVNRIAPPKPN